MIPWFSDQHLFGLYFPKYFYLFVEAFGHQLFHFLVIFHNFFFSLSFFHSLPQIVLIFPYGFFFLHFFSLRCLSTQGWAPGHFYFPGLPIYFWVVCHKPRHSQDYFCLSQFIYIYPHLFYMSSVVHVDFHFMDYWSPLVITSIHISYFYGFI